MAVGFSGVVLTADALMANGAIWVVIQRLSVDQFNDFAKVSITQVDHRYPTRPLDACFPFETVD